MKEVGRIAAALEVGRTAAVVEFGRTAAALEVGRAAAVLEFGRTAACGQPRIQAEGAPDMVISREAASLQHPSPTPCRRKLAHTRLDRCCHKP